MTTIDTRTEAGPVAPSAERELTEAVGWTVTADSTRVGRLYVVSALIAGVLVLFLGMLLWVERADPDTAWVSAVQPLFSLYWFGLAFVVVVPLLLGLAMAVVPLQVGYPQVALPRAAALSYWAWLFGSIAMVVSVFLDGGIEGTDVKSVDLFLASLGVVLAALTVGAACVAATVLTLRNGGMRLTNAPAFAFASLVFASALAITSAMVVGKLILVYVDHRYGQPVWGEDAAGADLFWAVLQPTNYVYAIPILGIAADVVATASGRRFVGRPALLVALGLAGAAVIGAAFQGLYVLDFDDSSAWQDTMRTFVYLATAALPVLPFLVVLVLGGATAFKGRRRTGAAQLFALFALLMGLVGTLVGVLAPIDELGSLSDDPLHGTALQGAQANYMLLAGVLAGLAGLVQWGPKLWGRLLPDAPMGGLAVLGLFGVVLASFPDVVAGFLDVPLNDISTVVDEDEWVAALAVVSAVGFVILAGVLLVVVFAVARYFWLGRPAGDDPWDGQTLEWAVPSPPDGAIPELEVRSPEPLLDRKQEVRS